jgi:hypothetical protein
VLGSSCQLWLAAGNEPALGTRRRVEQIDALDAVHRFLTRRKVAIG